MIYTPHLHVASCILAIINVIWWIQFSAEYNPVCSMVSVWAVNRIFLCDVHPTSESNIVPVPTYVQVFETTLNTPTVTHFHPRANEMWEYRRHSQSPKNSHMAPTLYSLHTAQLMWHWKKWKIRAGKTNIKTLQQKSEHEKEHSPKKESKDLTLNSIKCQTFQHHLQWIQKVDTPVKRQCF